MADDEDKIFAYFTRLMFLVYRLTPEVSLDEWEYNNCNKKVTKNEKEFKTKQ